MAGSLTPGQSTEQPQHQLPGIGCGGKAAQEDPAAAIKLMREHNSVIKRPLWDFGNGQFFAGWNEEAVKAIIDKG